MTQVALFDAPPVSLTPSGDDPLIDCIKSFGVHGEHFCQDLTLVIDEYVDDTLYDAMELRTAAKELDTIIGILSKRRTGLLEKSQQIINECQAAGHIKEGNLEIVPKVSQGRRSVDRELLIKDRKDVFDLLKMNKINAVNLEHTSTLAEIETSYTPTITDLKALLKKHHEAYLKPGEIITTYDIAIILEEDENGN